MDDNTDIDKDKSIRKVFVYKEDSDKDIAEWLDNLPPRSHSEEIRRVLKENISGAKDKDELLVNKMDEIEKVLRQVLLFLTENKLPTSTTKEQISNDNHDSNYVDAKDVLKDLGK